MAAMAPSIFAFQNQLDSLLEEELALLRGRDDTAAPGARPVYNRLIWNFTHGRRARWPTRRTTTSPTRTSDGDH